ncbi:MAG TPA: DNA repair protein RecO [Candidatus Saccharimonadales bacterium]|nr:DNA repair protein RecO [Candidatus Saccharimonadales bacterium]
MKQLVTKAIVLSRLDYGEADRILTVLTPTYGKLSLLAKGVRRVKSKLAGGIELFSVSDITFIKGRGSLDSLVSTRLVKHYGAIVKHIDRTMLGYELIKQLNHVTEDQPEADYFTLGEQLFEALDDARVSLLLIKFWFAAQLLRLAGHMPNLQTDVAGQKLEAAKRYGFDFDRMSFVLRPDGQFGPDHIKYLRLALSGNTPKVLNQVQGSVEILRDAAPLIQTMLRAVSLV